MFHSPSRCVELFQCDPSFFIYCRCMHSHAVITVTFFFLLRYAYKVDPLQQFFQRCVIIRFFFMFIRIFNYISFYNKSYLTIDIRTLNIIAVNYFTRFNLRFRLISRLDSIKYFINRYESVFFKIIFFKYVNNHGIYI